MVDHNKNRITSNYAKWLVANLPDGKVILFTDNDMTPQSQLLRAELARSGAGAQKLLVETHKLGSPDYQVRLAKLPNFAWPELSSEVASSKYVDVFLILNRLQEISVNTPIYYLHPSFGYFLEQFYLKPEKGIFRLMPYSTENNSLDKPPLTGEQVSTDESLANDILKSFVTVAEQSESLWKNKFLDSLVITGWLSRNLNHRGVELARNKQLKPAESLFLAACKLYEGSRNGNIIAQANLRQVNPMSDYEFDEKLDQLIEANKLIDANGDGELTDNEVNFALRTYGPVDEPQACFQLGRDFAEKTEIRQAYHELTRAAELTTTFPDPVFFIADMFISYKLFDKAELFIERLEAMNKANPFIPNQQIKLIRLQAGQMLSDSDPIETEKYLLSQLKPHMDSIPGLETLLEFHLDHDQNAKALALLDNWLKAHPNDLDRLTVKGNLLSWLKRYDDAIELFQSAIPEANTQEKSNLNSLIAAAYTEKGDYNLALKNIDDAIDTTGKQGFKFQKAVIYQRMDRHKDAISILSELVEIGEYNREVLAHRATSFMATKQHDNAKEDYEKLREFHPDAIGIYLNLAKIAEAKDQSLEALKNYELYLKYADPESARAENLQHVKTRVKQLQGGAP